VHTESLDLDISISFLLKGLRDFREMVDSRDRAGKIKDGPRLVCCSRK
jgi:hypothetical protein